MVEPKSTTRFSSINSSIILAQTDTTVGFLSQSAAQLYTIKGREQSKPFLTTYPSLKEFKRSSNRVPSSQKSFFRKSKKTTFITKNRAFRISPTSLDSQLLRNLKWNYSTSANESGKNFSFEFCEDKADIIVQNKYGLFESSSSTLIKLSSTKKVKLR